MSLLYSKLRLQIPQLSDGKNATITSPRGVNRSVPMTYPLTDVFVAGMDKYTVQAGITSETFAVGNGKLKKIVTEDASALTVASPPTKTTYLVGENLDVSGAVINATIEKADGTQETRNVASVATYTPPNGTQLNTQGTQRVNVGFGGLSSYFDVVVSIRSMLKKLPYKFNGGASVVLNGEIHLLGGDTAQNNEGYKHYKWNGTFWESVSTLPYSFAYGCAIVFNNEIHLLGGRNNENKHYKWDGSSWTSVSTLPYYFKGGGAIVFNNAIHILGGNYNTSTYKYHYKWDGSSWTSVSTLPYEFYYGGIVVFNNAIHILGGSYNTSTYKKHYKWDGSSWTSVSTLPYEFTNGGANIWNSGTSYEIIILGSGVNDYKQYDAQWDGTTWTVGSD